VINLSLRRIVFEVFKAAKS